MPPPLLPSINNNCVWIQPSHMEKLASDTHMCVSTHSETQIILIISHEISFSFPNLALLHALAAARGGQLFTFFFPPIQFFPRKLLTRALAGHCAKPSHVLPLRRSAAWRGRRESTPGAAPLTLPPLSLTSSLSHRKGEWAREGGLSGGASETDSAAWMSHAGTVFQSCVELQHEPSQPPVNISGGGLG